MSILHPPSPAGNQANGNPTYKSCLKKRKRRTKAEIIALKEAAYEIIESGRPMTVRQVFYRLVVAGLIEKTQNEYKNTVSRLLTDMRRDGDLPFSWITDGTRLRRKPDSYSSLHEALELTAQTYRRALWDNQDAYVEVWCESAAVAGVLYGVTAKWDVPLLPAGGFSSVSFLYAAAKEIEAAEKPAFVYYFGDYDPSGVFIDRKIEEGLREYAPDAEIAFERVAVTPAQIEAWNLPGSPKKATDSRSKSFDGDAVEIEAIDPGTLRNICDSCISQHVDEHALRQLLEIEEAERESAYALALNLEGDE